jgi:hypothetical protein
MSFYTGRYMLMHGSTWNGVPLSVGEWKYIHYEGFVPQLFDLHADPHELHDLGLSPAHANVRAALHERLFTWLRTRRTRVTTTKAMAAQRTASARRRGIVLGEW